jgi:hypothetical protein
VRVSLLREYRPPAWRFAGDAAVWRAGRQIPDESPAQQYALRCGEDGGISWPDTVEEP